MGRARARLVLLAATLLAGAGPAAAQPRGPVPDGLYEGWSMVTLTPYGPLSSQAAGSGARWLDVRTQSGVTEVQFLPEGTLRWTVRYGPHGIVEKVAMVDGELWTRSVFAYDASGHLATKVVTGPGIGGGPVRFRYRTDRTGRVLAREPDDRSRPRLAYSVVAGSTTVDTIDGGQVIRRDRFDRDGRLLSTELGHPVSGQNTVALLYRRDRRGVLRGTFRRLGSRSPVQPARPADRDASVTEAALGALSHNVVERHEVRLLLGRPVTYSATLQGIRRSARDNYFNGCQLNALNGFDYDAAGLVKTARMDCICGFCVAEESHPRAADVVGRDLHWTEGPWVRLDGVVVTADHDVVTPDGPRPAGELRAGDRVSTADGGTRVLGSVERLVDGERLGINLRTGSGTFEAGGILFVSEDGACEQD